MQLLRFAQRGELLEVMAPPHSRLAYAIQEFAFQYLFGGLRRRHRTRRHELQGQLCHDAFPGPSLEPNQANVPDPELGQFLTLVFRFDLFYVHFAFPLVAADVKSQAEYEAQPEHQTEPDRVGLQLLEPLKNYANRGRA